MADAKGRRTAAQDLVVALSSAVWSRRFYPPDHPVIRSFSEKIGGILAVLTGESDEAVVGIVGEEIVFEGRPILGPVVFLSNFVRELRRRDIEKIAFRKGVEERETDELIAMINEDPWEVLAFGSPRVYLQKKGVNRILLGRLSTGGALQEEGMALAASQVYRQGLDLFRRITTSITGGEGLPMGEVDDLTSLMARQATRHKGSLARLTNLRTHDEYTYTHAVNVALLTVLQGEALGCDETTLNDLGAAGLLHDLGKLAIPPEILNKCGALTDAEWAVMRRHPVEGAMMLRKEANVPPIAIVAAFEHHTRIDLAGYPRLERSPRSHFVGMMVAVADCYDAMRSLRCYQKDLSPEDAYRRMMDLRGKILEPNLVDLFFSVLGIYPPGTFVRLSNGQIGIVMESNRGDIQRPKVGIIRDVRGTEIEEPLLLDLAKDYRDRGEKALAIGGSVDAAVEGISAAKYL